MPWKKSIWTVAGSQGMTNIYVGNLPYGLSDAELQEAFAAYGAVSTAKVVMDRQTGRSRGFGFVEMENDSEAEAAIQGLNGAELGGRKLIVNQARPKQ
jgi:cold-inducible RNA-binding protein